MVVGQIFVHLDLVHEDKKQYYDNLVVVDG